MNNPFNCWKHSKRSIRNYYMLKHIKVMGAMIQLEKTIPYTGGRFFVNEFSEVFDRRRNKIPIIIKDKKKYINISWYDGQKDYELGLVILSAFDKIDYDDTIYNRVRVIYRDGDGENCFLTNLTYLFKDGPIESLIPGFYLIPGVSRYVMNRNGEVISLKTNEFKKWSIAKGNETKNKKPGYEYAGFILNTGSVILSKHRLMGITFLPLEKYENKPFNKLTINHRDGVKSNSVLDNLEWATYSENNKHAWDSGLKLQKRPRILLKNLLTNEIKSFRSVRECARYLGDSGGFYVSNRLDDQSGKIYPDYLQFKRDDGSEWPTIKPEDIQYNALVNPIIARNVFTGKIFIFNDVVEDSKYIGVRPDIVLEHARTEQVIPNTGYNFKYQLSKSEWPNHSKKHLEVYKDHPINPPDGLIMTDTVSGEETFFTSAKKCMVEMGIERAHLYTLIFSGRLFKKRYCFKLFKLRDNLN